MSELAVVAAVSIGLLAIGGGGLLALGRPRSRSGLTVLAVVFGLWSVLAGAVLFDQLQGSRRVLPAAVGVALGLLGVGVSLRRRSAVEPSSRSGGGR